VNDSDIDTNDLTTTLVGVSKQGVTASVLNGDSISYTPPLNFFGTDTFAYQICDNGTPVLCDTAMVFITVNPVNDKPNAMPDTLMIEEDNPIIVNVQINDFDIDTNKLVTTIIDSSSQGAMLTVLNGDSISYTPPLNFNGVDTITYQVCDDGTPTLCDTSFVFITVTPINDKPIAVNDRDTTNEDTPVTILVQKNDSDIDMDDLKTTFIGVSKQGITASVINSDSLVYLPPLNFTGNDTFSYQICDSGLPTLCDTAMVFITIYPINDKPIADNDVVSTNEDATISIPVQVNDSDIDGDSLFTSILGNSTQGVTASIQNNNLIYTPPLNFNGMDTVSYIICDNGYPVLCDTATVFITIVPVNDPPNAIIDSAFTSEDTSLAINVLINDFDIDEDTLTFSIITYSSLKTTPTKINQDSIYYTPNPDFFGLDSITYQVCDDDMPSLCDTNFVIIIVRPVNDSPLAIDDINTTTPNTPVSSNVLTNDQDIENDSLFVIPTPLNVKNGSVTIDAAGNYTFTPFNNVSGVVSFEYQICDSGTPSLCDTAKVIIDLIDNSSPLNNMIIGMEDNFITKANKLIKANLISNDNDPDGDDISLNTTPVHAPANGSISLMPDGNFLYQPDSNFVGLDQFVYQVCDNGTPQSCDSVIVRIEIINDFGQNTTFATDDAGIGTEFQSISGNVILNDNDPEGDKQTVTISPITFPLNGELSIDSTGIYIYKPKPGFKGNDQFLYAICDNGLPRVCDTATVSLTVLNINELFAINDINQTLVGFNVSGNVLTNDIDPEGDSLFTRTTLISSPSNGFANLNADGSYNYTPKPNFSGNDVFEYQVCDNGAPVVCDTAQVHIQVRKGFNQFGNNIIGHPDNITIDANQTFNGCLTCNDVDPENDHLIINTNPISYVKNGKLTIHQNGTFSYTPDDNFLGQDNFTYSICDETPESLCDTVNVTLQVRPNNGKNDTYATDDAWMQTRNKELRGNLLSNDNDPEGDLQILTGLIPNAAASLLNGVSNGALTLYPNGDFVYTPNRDFIGNDQFIYQVCDNNPIQACTKATVYISIIPPNNSPLIIDPCACLNNETEPGNGQFSEKISILSIRPNEQWSIVQNTGLFGNSGPNASLIPIGTVAKANGLHNGYYHYFIDGVHIDAIGYQAKLYNGSDTIDINNVCYYQQSCRKDITTNPDGLPSVDSCAQNLIMGSNAIPREDSLNCCDNKTTFTDDGTIDGLYKDSKPRDDRFTVCPQNQWQTLKYNFSEFGLAPGDSLIVYDGKTVSDPVIGKFVGEGVGQTGGWVASNCDPFANLGSCLTFRLITNGDNVKSVGWNGNFECIERDITITPPNDLAANLKCEQTYTNLNIKPATVKAACGTVLDSQIVRIFNHKGDLCLDTCMAANQTINEAFAIGSYLVEYKLKSDTIKAAKAVLTVQGHSLICNDIVNIPLGSACAVTITPDDLLETTCDTITDTIYYFITLNGVDKNGKEIIIASGGGKGGNYPTITKDAIQACASNITATIEKRYYYGLDLSICNNGPHTEKCEVEINLKDQTPPIFAESTTTDTFKLCSFDLSEATFATLKPKAIDNCSQATVSFIDATLVNQANDVCDTTRVNVSWKATDECNNSTTLTQLVVIIRPNLNDLVKAPDVVLSCDDNQVTALNNFDKTGTPGIKVGKIKNGILIPSDTLYLNETDYTCGYILQKRTVEIPADCGIKVFRYWDILDWCDSTGIMPIDTQLIEFKDTLAPNFVLNTLSPRTLVLQHDACTMDISKLEKPEATDNCSTPSVHIDSVFRIENGIEWPVSHSQLSALDCDSFLVRWIAEDLCHEQLTNDTITQIIIIEDHTKPSAVCHDKFHLSLSKDLISIHYRELDAGSYDACGIDKYEVSRDEINWNSLLQFTCEDIHQEINVFLRVTDKKGNQATCWSKVIVEDKIAPICSDLPNQTAYCDENHFANDLETTDLNDNGAMDEDEWKALSKEQMELFNQQFGNPNCSDNVSCNELTFEQAYQFIPSDCGRGKIKRRYRTIDWDGQGLASNWAEQIINIESKEDWSITLPADWKGNCGDSIPNSELIIQNGKCDLLSYDVEEKVFTAIEGTCLKVVRTFTITNLCTYQAGTEPIRISRIENQYGEVLENKVITSEEFQKIGRLTYIQVLKLKDDMPPVITFEQIDTCISNDQCSEEKLFAISAEDCNDLVTSQLTYNWTLSENGIELAKGQGNTFHATVVPDVTYQVDWKVADNCGNTTSDSKTYTFTDCKKPSPYCIHGIAVDLMQTNATVQVWTKDMAQSADDNCTNQDRLDYRIWHASLGDEPTDLEGVHKLPKVITFTCEHLGNQVVNLYLIDEQNNWDFCSTFVMVQDNSKACEQQTDMAVVSGTIMDWKTQTVEEVQVNTTDNQSMMTQEDGHYLFDLPMHQDYTITPKKNVDPLNGVSTFDLVLITKHILGIQNFDNPYQLIAADVNKSGAITTFDIVQIRQLILNITDEFTHNESWRFVEASYEFTSDNPLTENFPEVAIIRDLAKDMEKDFVAIKIGDVNGNALANNLMVAEERKAPQKLQISTQDINLEAGKQYIITFNTKQLDAIQGYQFTLGSEHIDLHKVIPNATGLENFGLKDLEKGIITTSWIQSELELSKQDKSNSAIATDLFTLEFTALHDGQLSEQIQLLNRPTAIEAYDKEDQIMDIELVFPTTLSQDEFELFQNQPNPFFDHTNIGFYLPGDSEIQLILRDETGRILKTIQEDRKAGYNTIRIQKEEVTNGFIYYQLHTKFGVKAKKMLQIK
jgi:hypothetical protein